MTTARFARQALAALTFVVATATAVAETDLERRFTMVQKLIESSSGADQVRKSGVAAAIAARDRALARLEQARTATAEGRNDDASGLLTEASREMFDATRLASEGFTNQKDREDLATRRDSVAALLAALERIEAENGTDEHTKVREQVTSLLTAADDRARAGDLDAAREGTQQAYLLLKVALEELRGGKTLVRSLDFASREEEFRYELDRNDTHQMLLRSLQAKSDPNDAKRKMGDAMMATALGHRADADRMAAEKRFEDAIERLDASTKELIRAIRVSGIYIPG